MTSFEREYREAMDELYASAGSFGNIAARLGVPRANESIPTAQVSWNPQEKLTTFEINPEFFHGLTPRQRGAVIAHEAYHVLLGHLLEAGDPYYKNHHARTLAQECIINDGLSSSTGLPLPLNVEGAHPCLGTELFGADFSYFTTRQGYDYIMQDREDEEREKGEEGGSTSPSESDVSEEKGGGNAKEESSSNGNGESEEKGEEEESDDSAVAENGVSNEADESSTPTPSAPESEDTSTPESEEKNGESPQSPSEGSKEAHSSTATSDASTGGREASGTLCGGVELNGGDPQEVKEAVAQAVQQAMDEMSDDEIQNLSDEVSDMLINSGASGDSFGLGKAGNLITAKASEINVSWRKILEKVNPEVKNYGRRKRGDDWTRPNPRYVSIYPDVVIPRSMPHKPHGKGKGDSVPTIIVALDLSYSIPRELVNDLLAMVNDTPDELVRAIPVTWSDEPEEYDEATGKIVAPGGTNVTALYHWCLDKGKSLGIPDPHVFVITDGECSFYGPVDTKYLREKWHWCCIRPKDEKSLQRYFSKYLTEHNVHHLKDFQ